MKTNILENIIHVPKKGEPIYIRSGFPHAPTFVWLGKTRAPMLQPREASRTKNGKQGQPL